jgi:hypothetical protein
MTIAQVKAQRLAQLRKVIAALRTYDSAQEALERLLKRYRGKKTIIESDDMPALNNAYSKMNANFSKIETELAGLIRLVG